MFDETFYYEGIHYEARKLWNRDSWVMEEEKPENLFNSEIF